MNREAVLKVLVPMWTSRAETARRLKQNIKTVMGWAVAHNFIENNPANEGLDPALPHVPVVKAHHRALMHQWARYVTGEGQGKVVRIHG